MRVIAGDIGGTNLRLALVELGAGAEGQRTARVVERRSLPVAEQPDLGTPLEAFVREHGGDADAPHRACLGIAGTVHADRVEGVNLPWAIDPEQLLVQSSLEQVKLINDFHAAARGLELLASDDLVAIGAASPQPGAPVAILGAGTGLGEAFLLPERPGGAAGWRVVPTEAGHRDFAPCDDLQDRLLTFLRARHGRVSTERVLSGPGLAATYTFLVEVEGRPPAAAVEAADAERKPLEISTCALTDRHPTCAEAVDLFVDVYGAEAGNVALTALARGGVYLAGGIAPDLFGDASLRARFRAAFEDKGRFRGYLSEVPVWVVTNEDLGLLGAANEAAL